MIYLVSPGVMFGLTVSALYAGLFHVWGGTTLRDLVVYLLASIVGFAVGQLVGVLLGLPLPHVGHVYIVEASLCSWLAMIGVRELRNGQRGQEVDRL